MREVLLGKSGIKPGWSYFLAVMCVLAFSAVYEIIEMVAAVLVSPELGTAYLGTQGDEWDAQKDGALAGTGAVLAMFAGWSFERRRQAARACAP